MMLQTFEMDLLGMSHEQCMLHYWQKRLKDRQDEYDFIGEQNAIQVYNSAQAWMNANILKRIRELQATLQKEFQEKMKGLMASPKLTMQDIRKMDLRWLQL